MAEKHTNILIVDDDEIVCQLLYDYFTQYFASSDYKIFSANSGEDACRIVANDPIDIVFLDLKLGKDNGATVLPSLLSVKPDLKVIVITGEPTLQSAEEAKQKGAYGYFLKPLDLGELGRVVRMIGDTQPGEPKNVRRKKLTTTTTYDFSSEEVDREIVKIIPERIAKAFSILSIGLVDGKLKVAMADPLDVVAIDSIKAYSGYDVEPVPASKEELTGAIARYYSETVDLEKSIQDLVTVETGQVEEAEPDVEQLRVEAGDAPVVRLVNLVLLQAIEARSTDIHIEPREKTLAIRFRVDGILREVNAPPKKMQWAITSRVKILSDLDISERRRPQDGRCRIRLREKDVDIRVSTLPTIYGEKVVMRLLDKSNVFDDIGGLGLEAKEQKSFIKAIERPHGMLLVTGPTGSGKTTTLYTALNYINTSSINIITVEDPVEYELEGINQVHVRADIGLTFANALRSILRQDPDVIMIGEIRDLETASIAVRSALTGHLVFSTLHTNSAVSTVTRLVDMGLEPYLIVSCLNMVVAQRLVRRICPDCKEEYTPSLEELKLVEPEIVTGDKITYYRGAGCESCGGAGYRGRMAIYEMLEMDKEIAELTIKGASENEMQQCVLEKGMITLMRSGLNKARKGLTTVEEVLRVAVSE